MFPEHLQTGYKSHPDLINSLRLKLFLLPRWSINVNFENHSAHKHYTEFEFVLYPIYNARQVSDLFSLIILVSCFGTQHAICSVCYSPCKLLEVVTCSFGALLLSKCVNLQTLNFLHLITTFVGEGGWGWGWGGVTTSVLLRSWR